MAKKIKQNGSNRLLGGYVPESVFKAIRTWVSRGEERDISKFIREAAREKLRRENIPYNGK